MAPDQLVVGGTYVNRKGQQRTILSIGPLGTKGANTVAYARGAKELAKEFCSANTQVENFAQWATRRIA